LLVNCSTALNMTMQPLRRRPGGDWESYQTYTPVRGKLPTHIAAREYGYATMIKARARLAKIATSRAQGAAQCPAKQTKPAPKPASAPQLKKSMSSLQKSKQRLKHHALEEKGAKLSASTSPTPSQL
jgi:hypothetical protein